MAPPQLGDEPGESSGQPGKPLRRAELGLAALLFALVAALPVGRSLWDGELVFFALDHAAAQEPWSGALGDATPAPRNPSLSDQALAFYPAYRFVAESLARGELPLWNPGVHAGVPCLANPQWGALDPQVWALAALERGGGRELFDRGLAWVAWGRLLAAGLGAYVLGRRLSLGSSGAALAGVTFALSGFLVGWLNFSLGHVVPLLPWVLLALEGTRGPRPTRAIGATAFAFAVLVLGGHPETAFFCGLAATAWALGIFASDRRAGWRALAGLALGVALAGASLVPFVEYLANSSALVAHAAASPPAGPDLVALGVLIALAGLVATGRAACDSRSVPWVGVLGIAFFFGGVAFLLARRGLADGAGVALVHDLFGAPGAGGYHGAGSYVEPASAWIATAPLVLALASFLAERGPLARRNLIGAVAAIAFLLALEVPGVVDLWRRLPLVGFAATNRAGGVAALALALLAGDALEGALRGARVAAVATVAVLAALALVPSGPAPLDELLARADPSDELFVLTEPVPRTLDRGRASVAGTLHAGVPVAAARVRVERIDDDGRPTGDARHVPVELREVDGATLFRCDHVEANRLEPGHWRLVLEILRRGADGTLEAIGERRLGATTVERRRGIGLASGLCLLLSILAVAVLPLGASARARWVVVALALAHGLVFARGMNPATPRVEAFPATRTTELARDMMGRGRVLGGPGVLAANTGLVDGLRMLGGYDALDVASFSAYRAYAQRAGAQGLLDWNARGVDLDSPAFRLLGVTVLATRHPLEHPGWELVAGPGDGAPEPAETWVYRARSPLPRAFCVDRIVSRDEALADLEGFEPLGAAFLEDGRDWSIVRPFTSATVESLELGRDGLRAVCELDGEGLLVLTEQAFPGWSATVDGEPAEVWTVDSIFRGVALDAGRHELVLRYRPASWRWGLALSLAALVAAVLLLVWGQFRRRPAV